MGVTLPSSAVTCLVMSGSPVRCKQGPAEQQVTQGETNAAVRVVEQAAAVPPVYGC